MTSDDPWRWLKPLAIATQWLATGEHLFRRGDRITSMYLVQRGSLELVRTLPDGAAMTLAIFVEGELAGEASLFASAYHCDAIAASPLEVLRFPGTRLSTRCAQTRTRPSPCSVTWHAVFKRVALP